MNVEITRLSNGLTIVTDPMPELASAALGVWVDAGARGETRETSDMERRVAYDLWYIRNWSIWLDTYILARTIRAVMTGDGAC